MDFAISAVLIVTMFVLAWKLADKIVVALDSERCQAHKTTALLSQRLHRARVTMQRTMREARCYIDDPEIHVELFDEEAVALADGAWTVLDRAGEKSASDAGSIKWVRLPSGALRRQAQESDE